MHNFSKTLKKSFEPILFCLLIAATCVLCIDRRYSVAVLDGVSLYVVSVLPALFPYFFITAILSSMKVTGKIGAKLSPITTRLFNTGGLVGYAYLMSVISGYPVGAKIISDLKSNGLISDTEAVRASTFCSTPSPMFLIGSVGNITFGDFRFGLFLFLTCLISSFIVGFIFSFYKRKDKPLPVLFYSTPKTDNLIYESTYSAVTSVLTVGGFITIFYVLTEMLFNLKILTPIEYLIKLLGGGESLSHGVTLGLFECTKGLKSLANGGVSFLALPVSAMLCGFGGLCVITQSVAYLKKAKINTAVFILAKLLTAVICFAIGLLFAFLL